MGHIYLTCKWNEAVTLQGCHKDVTDLAMRKYKGTMQSRHSSFRANLHTGKGIFFPIPSADLTGTSRRTCPGCCLVFTFVSSAGIVAIGQGVVKTFILISIFGCLHMLVAGDTVMDQNPHKYPAPPWGRSSQTVYNTSGVGDSALRRNKVGYGIRPTWGGGLLV